MNKRKGATNIWLIVLVIGVLAYASGLIGQPFAAGATQTPGIVTVREDCQTDGTDDLGLLVRNKLATTASLNIRSSIAAFDNVGNLVASGTSDGSATSAYTNLAIPCDDVKQVGSAYVLAGTAAPGTLVNSAKVPYDIRLEKTKQEVIAGTNSSSLGSMCWRDTALANISSCGSTADVNSANFSAAVTMGASETITRVFEFQVNTASAQFGSDDGGILVSVDTSDSAVISDNAISVTSSQVALTPLDRCPLEAASFNSANRCYKMPAIKNSDGLVRFTVVVQSDLGNPGTSADPRIYFDDVQYFEEDAQVKQGIYNKGGTNIGVARQQFGVDLS